MARAGRAAYREAVVAAARGLRDRVVAVAGPHRQSRASEVGLAAVASAGSPDAHMLGCGHARTYASRHARPRGRFGASARPRSPHRDPEGRERDPEAPSPPPRRGRREKPRRRNGRSASFRLSRDGSGRGRPSAPVVVEAARGLSAVQRPTEPQTVEALYAIRRSAGMAGQRLGARAPTRRSG